MTNVLRVVMVAMLVWGNLAFATLPTKASNAGQDLRIISSWMAHLNYFYPGLEVAPARDADLSRDEVRRQLLQDLSYLEQSLGGTVRVPHSSLKQIACGRPECTGGGGGGKCSTCEVDK